MCKASDVTGSPSTGFSGPDLCGVRKACGLDLLSISNPRGTFQADSTVVDRL
jgi:hypothetical protein